MPARGSATVTVKLTVNGNNLRNNLMNSGSLGNAIGPLTANEYDGYIVFQGADHKVTMPWHILPRKAAQVVAKFTTATHPARPEHGRSLERLENQGVGDAQVQTFSMVATGTDRPGGEHGEQTPNPDIRAIGVNSFLAFRAGVCGATQNFIWEFAFNMFERKATPVGTWHEVDLDVNGDGNTDYFVINQDVSGADHAHRWKAGDVGHQRPPPVPAYRALLRGARDQHVERHPACMRAVTSA